MDNEKISKYMKNLKNTLQELKEERQEILEKFSNGESLSRKDVKKNKELALQIKEIQDKLTKFNNLNLFDDMSFSLEVINDEDITYEEKLQEIETLIPQFESFNNSAQETLLNETELSEDDLQKLDEVVNEINEELNALNAELRLAKRKKLDTSDIEEDIKNNNHKINAINNYQTNLLDLNKIEQDLYDLANSDDKEEKIMIMATYNSIINVEKENCINEIQEVIENEKIDEDVLDAEFVESEDLDNNELSLKDRTKKNLEKISNFLKANGKKITLIGGTAALCVTIALIARSCSKQIENSKNDDTTNKFEIEQTYENVNKEVLEALVNKGYNEYAAMLMAENFDDATLKALQNIPYNPAVENYATEKEFNIDYLNDYENARNIYNITAEKTVDYVNRSKKIQETGFYEDAPINDIVGVTKSIDEQTLFTKEGDGLEQTIYAAITNIYNTYAFTNESQENDIKKLEAFKYFAKDNSELDLFLTEYATLIQNVLNSKGNQEESTKAKQNVYNYLDTFANTFAGNKYDIGNSNENAIITDTYDWNIAYHSFVEPPISMFITEKNANDFACLQINMLSNYQQWAQLNGCYLEEESQTLGGR